MNARASPFPLAPNTFGRRLTVPVPVTVAVVVPSATPTLTASFFLFSCSSISLSLPAVPCAAPMALNNRTTPLCANFLNLFSLSAPVSSFSSSLPPLLAVSKALALLLSHCENGRGGRDPHPPMTSRT